MISLNLPPFSLSQSSGPFTHIMQAYVVVIITETVDPMEQTTQLWVICYCLDSLILSINIGSS